MEEEKRAITIQRHMSSYPNFEKLTALLNQQKHPKRMLKTIVSLTKPLTNGCNHC